MWHKRQVSLQTICRQTVVVVIASALGIGALSSITSAATPQLQQFLLRADEQPGFSPSGTVVAANKPSKFLHGSAKGSEAQALQNYGFVAAAGEEMTGPAGSLGNSEVIAFKSAAGAKKGLALSLSLDSSGFAREFGGCARRQGVTRARFHHPSGRSSNRVLDGWQLHA